MVCHLLAVQADLLRVECEETLPTKATLKKMLNTLQNIMKTLEKYGDKNAMEELAQKRETVKDLLNVVDPSLGIGQKMSKYWGTA